MIRQIAFRDFVVDKLWWLEKQLFRVERRLWAEPVTWQSRNPWRPPDNNISVHFIIPLISPERTNNWHSVCENLNRTLSSLRRQTNGSWTAAVSCQARPEGIEFDDKVSFLRYPLPHHRDHFDKASKLRALIKNAARDKKRDGYIYFLDADDILHPRLVEYVVSDNNGHGYYANKGYLIDFRRRRAVPYGIEPNTETPLFLLNGSVTAVRFDTRRSDNAMYPPLLRGAHMRAHEKLQEFGFHLKPIPFPTILYNFNHGDNFWTYRGKDKTQQDALTNTLTDSRYYREAMNEFGLVP